MAEIIYKFVKGKGWVAGYDEGILLTLNGFSFCQPGDRLSTTDGAEYVVISNVSGLVTVQLIRPAPIRNITIEGIVGV